MSCFKTCCSCEDLFLATAKPPHAQQILQEVRCSRTLLISLITAVVRSRVGITGAAALVIQRLLENAVRCCSRARSATASRVVQLV